MKKLTVKCFDVLGVAKSKFMRDAILEKLADVVDSELINAVMGKGEKSLSSSQAKRELGLEE